MAAVVLAGEMTTEIIVTMTGAGGLEAEVLVIEGAEAEEVEGGVEARLGIGKVVLKEGRRSNSGIERGNSRNLLTSMKIVTITMTVMVVDKMEGSTMTPSSSLMNTTIHPIDIVRWSTGSLF